MEYLALSLLVGIGAGALGMKVHSSRKLETERKAKELAALKRFRVTILGDDIEVTNAEQANQLSTIHLDPAVLTAIELDRIIQQDLNALHNEVDDSDRGRRKFIREAVSYCEAICSGYQKIGAIALAIYGKEELIPHYTRNELKAIRNMSLTTRARIVALTNVGHKAFFHGTTESNFEGGEWQKACAMIEKRHLITHPSCAEDLKVSDADWPDLHAGALFLIQEVYRPNQLMKDRLDAEEQ